jgi:hypothetical protein
MVKVQKILSDRDFLKYRNKTRLYEADEFDTLTEDNTGTENTEGDKALTDEELKIESLKIATNIGKLLKDITAQDIVTIAGTVSAFIKNYEVEGSSHEMSGQQPPVNASSEDNIEDVDFADADLTDDNTDEA